MEHLPTGMTNWGPGEWSMFFIALATFVTTMVNLFRNATAAKLQENADKIEENTKVTKEGNITGDEIKTQLNGALDEKITGIVAAHLKPIADMFQDHREEVARDMRYIRQGLADLKQKP